MKIVLLGTPGAGKGTQADTISEIKGIPHISTGDMFRQAVNDQTPIGLEAKSFMDHGALVPDEITNGIVRERLARPDCVGGFILDGFPRTVDQAVALDGILMEKKEKLRLAMHIEVSPDTLVGRLSGRRTCKNCGALYHIDYSPPKQGEVCDRCGGSLYLRDDDRPETIRRRLEVYYEQTLPLIRFYRDKGLLTTIDGNQDKKQVTSDILAILAGGSPHKHEEG